jgi:hypothetical protein
MTLTNIDKLKALKKVSSFLNERIDQLTEEKEKIESELLSGDNIFINDNGETTYQILKLNKFYDSGIIKNGEFKRIICLKGVFTIEFPEHGDHGLVHSPNTILVPPQTEHIIKCLDDCEVLIVYKPNFNISRYKIIEENTIYKKENF